MQKVEKEFKRFLKERGYRKTPERMAILREVMASNGHFEADDIFIRLRRKNPKASQASVYRMINLLVEACIVRKTPCAQMESRYEVIYGIDHHDHLVCIKCGRIIEFKDENIEKLQEKVALNHHFTLTGHRLILSGYCSQCKS